MIVFIYPSSAATFASRVSIFAIASFNAAVKTGISFV